MKERKRRSNPADIPYDHGVPLESALARREMLANKYDREFGKERVFPALIDALLEEVPAGCSVLEVGAATGILTRPLLEVAGRLTALEPSAGMLRRLLSSDVATSPKLRITQGMAEDLPEDEMYDVAVVTFTPRRGLGLMRLLTQLATRVEQRVVMLLDDDPSMDWAYLARGAAIQGFEVRLRFIHGPASSLVDAAKRTVLLTAEVAEWTPSAVPTGGWTLDAREIRVPFPPPRGAATRIVRYFLAGGDRALFVVTDPRGADRLHGNLRTAVHRLGKDELTVRKHGDGEAIQIVRLPKAGTTELEDAGL